MDLDGGNVGGLRARRSPALPDFSFNPGSRLSPETLETQPRTPPLPTFNFNPGAATTPDSSMLSPPLSPSSPRMGPNRGSHRRYGSEFVGGKLKAGESITVMSTSPTKEESGYASPTLAPVEPTVQRRGRHAHRRSAAISSHDLTMILKPTSPNPRGSSAPASPTDFDKKMKPFSENSSELRKAIEVEPETEKAEPKQLTPVESFQEPSPIEKPTPRARVGFSDTLEFIPRPLSLVSTDTASTVRGPGHSVSGSISSIISMSSSITTDREVHETIGSPTSTKQTDSRPSTAGAVLERTPSLLYAMNVNDAAPAPRRRNSIPTLPGLSTAEPASPSLPSPIKTPKRWSFFGLEALASSGSPTKPRRHSSDSADTALKTPNQTNSSSENVSDAGDDEAESQSDSKKSTNTKKKQKKVKTWAGSILTRKTKSRSRKKSTRPRSLTSPLPQEDGDDDMEEDGTEIVEPPAAPTVMVTESPCPPAPASPKPEEDASYPMIDLDAALGPFNTPSTRDPAWEEAQRAGAPPKRQLHSAAGMRGFQGPGMHYHRRAESAPEMPPFEAGRFGIPRFGSSSTMADVFEEDEEDEAESGPKSPSEESTPEASGASVVDGDVESADEMVSTPTQEIELGVKTSRESFALNTSIKRKGSGSSLDMQPPGSRMRTDTSANSLHEEVIVEEPVRAAADQERISIYETIPDSTDAAPSPRRIITNKDLAPVEIHPISLGAPSVMPASPYSMSHSSYPSPRSPMSYEAHRVSTAPSSVTEENNFQSLLMGEPGPEVVRISVDIPSLASSNSTMTRDSTYPGVRPRNAPFHDQRPASFTSTSFGRRRSSLASLSRLISSAHGERSKLSIEVPFDNEPDKKQKLSKTKRLSRMMQFWKSKESTDS